MKQIKIAAILIFLSIALFSDTVTLKNGKVISNVKATVLKDSVRIEYENGRVEVRSEAEIKSNINSPVVWKEKTVPENAVPAKEAETETASQPNTFKNSIGMEFVMIPAGEFVMGCSSDDSECEGDEKPAHRVRITKPFYLGGFEVTQGQWKAVMGVNPSKFENCGDDCPVEEVSWISMQKYIEKLCAKEVEKSISLQNKCKYRLPTEAEWEYAARGSASLTDQSAKYYADNVDSIAWYDKNSGRKTHPAGQKKPNAFGLYDMSGNVMEWVNDRYNKEYYSNSPDTDPEGPAAGYGRVLRGGSWISGVLNVRASNRSHQGTESRGHAAGQCCQIKALYSGKTVAE